MPDYNPYTIFHREILAKMNGPDKAINEQRTAVGGVRRNQPWPVSLLLLAKWSVNSRYCLNPQGEFIGCSEMSLEQQIQAFGANGGCLQLPNQGLKNWNSTTSDRLVSRLPGCNSEPACYFSDA